jgi:hypothetical protein
MTIFLIPFDTELGVLPAGDMKEIFFRHGFVIEALRGADSGIPVV